MAVVQSYSTGAAICYVLPVLCTTSCLRMTARKRRQNKGVGLYSKELKRGQHGFVTVVHTQTADQVAVPVRRRSLMSTIALFFEKIQYTAMWQYIGRNQHQAAGALACAQDVMSLYDPLWESMTAFVRRK